MKRWLIDVKLMGCASTVCATFAPLLIAHGSGHFLNTASAGGLMALPTLAPYNATMHAVVGLTETLNAELRSVSTLLGATVLCPGLVDTPLGANSARLVPPGAAATPDDAGGMPAGAISPAVVAQAAIEAVEADRVHAIVGPGTEVGGAAAGGRTAGRSGLEQCRGAVGVDLHLDARDVVANGGFGLRRVGDHREHP